VEDTNNAVSDFYGLQRLVDVLAFPAISAFEYIERLSTSLANFKGEVKPYDDVTVLVIMKPAAAIVGDGQVS
jgi:serine phosphatase RsbU (regulator of sigma subunit)